MQATCDEAGEATAATESMLRAAATSLSCSSYCSTRPILTCSPSRITGHGITISGGTALMLAADQGHGACVKALRKDFGGQKQKKGTKKNML